MSDTNENVDVLIAGGGTAGLLLGLAVKQAAPDLDVEIVDPRPSWEPAKSSTSDLRASAIAAAARRMLASLGAWPDLEADAQPILSMEVTDSRTRDAVRPVILTFDGEVEEGEPFAHMVPNRRMGEVLLGLAHQAGLILTPAEGVADFSSSGGVQKITFTSGSARSAKLLVAADGVRSRLRGLAGIKTVSWRYEQKAIVTNVVHERPHNGVAIEHFLPSGPFAILPLTGDRSSLVWTERSADADRIMSMDDFVFGVELERRFGHHLGALELEGKRAAYPLGLTLARDLVRPRFALLGDAAHGIHPIAGQGLNLGFKDVAALSEVIIDAHRIGLDVGAFDVLERYEQWRRFDNWQMGATTDALNRLFSNDNPALRAARTIGLGLVDRMPIAKKWFIGEAAGFGGAQPRLLRGDAL